MFDRGTGGRKAQLRLEAKNADNEAEDVGERRSFVGCRCDTPTPHGCERGVLMSQCFVLLMSAAALPLDPERLQPRDIGSDRQV